MPRTCLCTLEEVRQYAIADLGQITPDSNPANILQKMIRVAMQAGVASPIMVVWERFVPMKDRFGPCQMLHECKEISSLWLESKIKRSNKPSESSEWKTEWPMHAFVLDGRRFTTPNYNVFCFSAFG